MIPVPDEVLRGHLREAEAPVLAMTIAHLTGDLSILDDADQRNGWLFQPQGGLPPRRQEEIRDRAFEVLRGHAGKVPPPSPELLRAITSWAMGVDTGDHLGLLSEEVAAPGADPRAPGWTMAELAPDRDFRVAVIGAGMSGLLMAYRLRQAGVPFVVFEKNGDVGGTWLDNTYPGCRVDVPSHLYSYSFTSGPDWPDHFCTADVVLEYFRGFAKEFGLYEHIRFNTEVEAAHWDEHAGRWRVTAGGETAEFDMVVSAVGQLNRPKIPDIPGLDRFAGPVFHSARWDHSADLTGRRVGMIGTGASAFQIIPEIAGATAELVVFQRTPPWLRPTPHYHDPVPGSVHWLRAHVPFYAAWQRFWLLAPGLRGVLEGWIVDPEYPPTERAISALNDEIRATLTEGLRAQLADAPELLEHVLPTYPVGAKRVLRDNGVWLSTVKRPDVNLVTSAITEITPGGVRTADGGEHHLDVLVLATGFRAAEFLVPMKVTGRGGADIHERWRTGARAYLGLAVPDFPNLFCLYGPNTNLSGQAGSIFFMSECAVRYVMDAIRLLLSSGRRALNVRPAVHDRYNDWVDEANARRAWGWSSVSTWVVDPATGRSAQNWPFSALEYWRRTRAVDPDDYVFGGTSARPGAGASVGVEFRPEVLRHPFARRGT